MVTHFIQSIFSYSGNVMLAAIISLLLVIFFVLLLHLYAKWFLAQARRRRPPPPSVVLRPSRFHHFHSSVITFENPLSKGLDASVISSIPLFVYRREEFKQIGMENLECIICLSGFGEGEFGRNLPKCKHCFHVECIDMWLHSHSSCPICRAPVVVEIGESAESDGNSSMDGDDGELFESESEIVIDVVSSDSGIANENKCLSEDEMAAAAAAALGCSLKRMLSRNVSECKVHPLSCVNGLEE